jgi:hypothetical protein
MINFQILESDQQILKSIMEESVPEVNRLFNSKVGQVTEITGNLLRKYIILQPEIQSLLNGSLRYELGIPDPSRRIFNIIDVLVQNISVKFKPFTVVGLKFKGGIILKAVNNTFSDIVHLDDAIQVTQKGTDLYWLKWLLEEGAQIIIFGWDVEFGPFGRTGGAHMIPGNGWSVPSEFAGDKQDNFITRAISEMRPELEEQIKACLV